MASPLSASDANVATTSQVIDQVQALYVGVTQDLNNCAVDYPG